MSKRLILFLVAVSLPVFAHAQNQDADLQKKEKEFFENLDKQVNQMASMLELEDWQVFYVDSILTHDYKAMQEELTALQRKKVSNADMYSEVAYKWQDKIDDAFHKVFNEEQWKKYQKSGAARSKKARDKKRAKSEQVSQNN